MYVANEHYRPTFHVMYMTCNAGIKKKLRTRTDFEEQ